MDTPITRLDALLQAQRTAWQVRTPDYAQRMDDLARLRRAFKARLEDFVRAVSADFGHRRVWKHGWPTACPCSMKSTMYANVCAAGCACAASPPMSSSFPRTAKS
jgi:hypothetical protein